MWYKTTIGEALAKFGVDQTKGLTNQQAAEAFSKYGPNQLHLGKKVNPLMLFLQQFKDVLIIILLLSATVSFGLAIYDHESPKESILIFIIVLAIAVIGFMNEYKAEKTVEALKKLVSAKAKVRRGGKIVEIDSTEIVSGDIIILDEGQKIPADVRLLAVKNLKIDEASLTGESLPVSKNTLELSADTSLADQKCMAFAGTFVVSGNAEGLVVETAQNTELGKIATLVSSVEADETPLQKKLNDLGKKLGIFILAVCIIVFLVVFFFVNEEFDEAFVHRLIFAFTAAVALAVAAIPEGLAFVVRISLALGARRMASKNALVRRLSAVEALGSTDIICTDKTGTLTKGEMTVRELWTLQSTVKLSGSGYETKGEFTMSGKKFKPSGLIAQLLELGALCNNAHLRNNETIIGDPTEAALLVSAAKAGIDYQSLGEARERIDEIPFDSQRKMMSTLNKTDSGFMVCAKGALEEIIANCSFVIDEKGKKAKLTDDHKKAIHRANKQMATQALRVLAFAYKDMEGAGESKDYEKDLIFTGLQAMMDPPRPEVVDVIHRIQTESGIRVVMITGDNIETATAIASEIGIKGEAVTGLQLEEMSQQEFETRVDSISIYARVNPEHKIRIVQALKKKGHQVAMTGDGVNDAPAIKAADIGIAMGITGTDAAKEASDLILLDDKFVTIIAAIEEGRGIFDNVRKFVNFLISCNVAEVLAILFGIILFNNLLLTAAQLLFINILTDGLPAIALGSDPAQTDVLTSKPKRFQEAIITSRVWAEMIIYGTLMSILLLVHYKYNQTHGSALTTISATFTAMIIYEKVRLVDIRSSYRIKWFSNPWLSVAIASTLIIQIAVLYVRPLANYFGVGPLPLRDWVFILMGSAGLFVLMKVLNPTLNRVFGTSH